MATRRGELGGTGRSYSARFQYSLPTDEYLSTLQWPSDIEIYNKMERSDAQVKATLLMLELPIRSTSWYLKSADNSSQAKKNKEFIEDNLFKGPPSGMKNHFDDFIKESCSMFTYGHAVFEKVFEVKNNFLQWKKFAPRPQSTLYDFLYNKFGDLTDVEQWIYQPSYTRVKMPKQKLIVFTHDMKQGDYRGRSVLRTAYKHWSIKDFLYKITNIGIERNFVGTPVITLPQNYDEADYARAKKIVTDLRSNQYGGITLPEGFLLELFEGKRTMVDVLPYIEHQDLLISRSILAQFMNLGSNSAGSFALSKDQTELFLMMLGAIAKYIANVINTEAIPQLIEFNFNSDLYPKLCFKPLGNNKILETLKNMVDGNLIIPDRDLEDWLRDMMELPEKSKESNSYNSSFAGKGENHDSETFEKNKIEIQNNKNQDKTDENKDEEILEKEKEIGENKQENNKDEKIKKMSEPASFLNIEKDFDNIESKFFNAARIIVEKQIKDLVNKAKNIKLSEIAKIEVGYKGAMTNFVIDAFEDAFNRGVKQMQKEIKTDYKPKLDNDILKAKASIVANNLSERIKTRFLNEYLISKDLGDTEKITKKIMRNIKK
jgi:hypothetical protein